MEMLIPWSRFYSANSLARTSRISVVAALMALVVLVGCYAPTDGPGTGSIEIVARVPVSAAGPISATDTVTTTEAGITALSTDAFIFAAVVDTALIARYRTQMEAVYNRLIVDAVFDAGIFAALTRRDIYSELGLDPPPLEIVRADFRGQARSVAQSTARTSGTFSFNELPAGRTYFVVMEAFGTTRDSS